LAQILILNINKFWFSIRKVTFYKIRRLIRWVRRTDFLAKLLMSTEKFSWKQTKCLTHRKGVVAMVSGREVGTNIQIGILSTKAFSAKNCTTNTVACEIGLRIIAKNIEIVTKIKAAG